MSPSAPVFIAAVDDSERARDALALAAALAAVVAARLVVANVRAPVSQPWYQGSDELEASLAQDSEAILKRARDRVPDDIRATVASVVDASVPKGLEELVEREQASLLVVARTERGFGRRAAGVPERLLHGAGCAVAVAPAGYAATESGPLQRVAAAYDGSPRARVALAQAANIARRAKAALTVLSVTDTSALAWAGPPAGSASPELVEQLQAGQRDEVEETLAALGVEAEVEILGGRPVDALVTRSRDLDLIVCGTRGLGAVTAVVLGTVSNALVHRAECPLIVVPEGSPLIDAGVSS